MARKVKAKDTDKEYVYEVTRGWCFTINNWTDEDCINFMVLEEIAQYGIVGFEIGEEKGTPHLQGYVYFRDAKTMRTVSRLLPRARLSQQRAKEASSAYEYCMKDGDYWEFGERPVQGAATWDKIVDTMKNPVSNFRLYQQYSKHYRQYMNEHAENRFEEYIEFKEDEPYQLSIKLKEYIEEGKTICHNIDLYKGQDVLVLPYWNFIEHKLGLFLYMEGQEWDVKRGYEIINVNPKIIILSDTSDVLRVKNK